jgi:hypothetical protein
MQFCNLMVLYLMLRPKSESGSKKSLRPYLYGALVLEDLTLTINKTNNI